MSPRIAVAALLLAGTPLLAQSLPKEAPGKPDPARVVAGRYTADPAHTLVEFQVDHLGFTPYFGLFGDASGTLTIDPKAVEATKVDMTIPVSRITTANAALTAHLLKPPASTGGKHDFFGPAPADARFVSRTVRRTGPLAATMSGHLTLNGVTKPVMLAVRFHGGGTMDMGQGRQRNLGFTATGRIQRSAFGLGSGIPLVSDAVDLKIAAAFTEAK